MTSPLNWSVEFYTDGRGRSPVAEFLQGLDAQTQARFIYSFEQLRIRNVLATEPLVRHLRDKLWEVRERSDGNTYRVIYFFFTGRRIVMLHGFQKKTLRTPRSEIETAEQHMRDFVSRPGGD